MQTSSRRWQFAVFFLSGFSGLVYQIVWLRQAFASFGVVTPVISVVLSVFMFGLGVGSWTSGSLVRRWPWSRAASLRVYAAIEFVIGVGGLVAPLVFQWGADRLLPVGETDSLTYLALSGGVIALALAPFCLCMGATFPVMLQAIRAEGGEAHGFSYLYLANVLGAMAGTLLTPLLLVELLGFRGAVLIAVAANWSAAAVAIHMSRSPAGASRGRETQPPSSRPEAQRPSPATSESAFPFRLWVLFTTGLASMGMEVVWARAFVPVLKTQVYSFAGLLFVYLLATWLGSALYRRHLARGRMWSTGRLLALLSLAAFVQILLGDPRIALPREWLQAAWILGSIVPYCGLLGYLTPKLIDEYSQGNPSAAGHAYAINVLGCIVGPLLVSYLLLPRLGLHLSGVLLAVPLWILSGIGIRLPSLPPPQQTREPSISDAATKRLPRDRSLTIWVAAALCGLIVAIFGTSYEDRYAAQGAAVYRDHTATVIASTAEDGGKILLVNGKPITTATPSTKLMAHLPLAWLSHQPQSALVICFGMGTTYRSLLSWDIDATAVELVPSVRDAFGDFFDDAEEIRQNPRGRIVIDDGRRFLQRTTLRFDVITLDPPPPPEAAASSLLYSREFYQLVKPRLTAGGILHQWFPGGELRTFQAVLRSVAEEFPHVRVLRAFDGWGYHILASEQPLGAPTAAELAGRMPQRAVRDLLEWSPRQTAESLFQMVLRRQFEVDEGVHPNRAVVITDDRPFNEYYLLRHLWQVWTGTYVIAL